MSSHSQVERRGQIPAANQQVPHPLRRKTDRDTHRVSLAGLLLLCVLAAFATFGVIALVFSSSHGLAK